MQGRGGCSRNSSGGRERRADPALPTAEGLPLVGGSVDGSRSPTSLRRQRRTLETLYRAALTGVDPGAAVDRAVGEPKLARLLRQARRVGVFAVGKAASGMARAAFPGRGPALVILPKGPRSLGVSAGLLSGRPSGPGTPPVLFDGEVLFAAHPEPDRSSLHAAHRAIRFFSSFGSNDLILCLISGGASSLLALPSKGLTLGEKRRRVRRLARAGASIKEINCLRKSLSAIKGGKLGRRTEARLATLVLSDVPGDDPALVGSGPTVRGRRGDLVHVVGSNADGLRAAALWARREGLSPTLRTRRLSGEAREAGARFGRAARRLAAGQVLLAGGETSVEMTRGNGRGGRSLEFALGAAFELEGSEGLALLAAGSDGVDGSSGAAGAFADGTTIARARRRKLDPRQVLQNHDTQPFFERLGDLFVTGPTGTNVSDWALAIRGE